MAVSGQRWRWPEGPLLLAAVLVKGKKRAAACGRCGHGVLISARRV
ncbi:hypothetical protein KCP69_09745 [Salmonella enterica subsp. enterica]|nr:hypothetical protein KCP69_09745 [Salmonella enterica subsp. enterica]